MSYRLVSWAEPGRRSLSPRDPGFMNPTVRLATNTFSQTPHRAGALCIGYALLVAAADWAATAVVVVAEL